MNEIKVGDNVRLKDTDFVGVAKWVGSSSCIVDFGLGDSAQLIENIEVLDVKTLFLTELQSLMRKYNASIYDYEQYKLCIDFKDGDGISYYWGDKPYKESCLTADNIMDFEKE